VRGLSPLHAGLDTLPMAVMTMVASPLSGRLVGTTGARLPLVSSGTALMIACAMLAWIEPSTPFTWLFLAYVLFGLGFGLVNAPITNAAVSGMPRAQAGVASAVASTSRQIGSTLGVAVVGAIVTSHLQGSVATGLAAASHAAWWILAGCGTVVLVLGVVATTRRAKDSAERTARELNPEVLRTEGVSR
jgi:MFS family permease